MAEARARRREPSASKSDLYGIQTRDIKRKKVDAGKATPIVSEP